MIFVGCVVAWAAAVNFGQFVGNAAAVVWAAAAVSAEVFVLAAAVVLARKPSLASIFVHVVLIKNLPLASLFDLSL